MGILGLTGKIKAGIVALEIGKLPRKICFNGQRLFATKVQIAILFRGSLYSGGEFGFQALETVTSFSTLMQHIHSRLVCLPPYTSFIPRRTSAFAKSLAAWAYSGLVPLLAPQYTATLPSCLRDSAELLVIQVRRDWRSNA